MQYFSDNGFSFEYYSDLSENVFINNQSTFTGISIPMKTLLNFVGKLKQDKMISEMEQKSYRDILGLWGRYCDTYTHLSKMRRRFSFFCAPN